MAGYNNTTLNETIIGNILPNSTQMIALRMIPVQRINRIVCCILGISLNIFVPIVIARSRQLWSPRNIHWLGVTFINFVTILQSLAELVTNVLYQRKDGSHLVMCKIHSTLLGCPFGLLLTSLTLASLDRYLALSRPQFYQNRVTNKSSITVSVMAFLLVAGFHTSPYWTGYYTAECGIRYNWLVITLFYQSFLSLTLVAIQIRLSFFIRNSLRHISPVENIEMEQMNENNGNESIKEQSINRMELRSAQILNAGILPFSIVSLTTITSSLLSVILQSLELGDSWNRSVQLISRELILLHLIYIPLVFISQSREFRFAAKRFYRPQVLQSEHNYS